MKWGIFDEPVVTELFHSYKALGRRLNEVALNPDNKHDLKFLTESNGSYTAVFIYVIPTPS